MLWKFKPGTQVTMLNPELLAGLVQLSRLMEIVFETKELTITSVTDGVHKPGSLHYTGNAVDIRTKGFDPVLVRACVRLFKASPPGSAHDLLFEFPGTANEHLHLEWDPTHTNG